MPSYRAVRGSVVLFSALAGALAIGMPAQADAQTWTPLTNLYPGRPNTMRLLTDGTIMVHDDFCSAGVRRLKPSAAGSYINGTWSSLAPMSTPRFYFASHVLPSGKVWVLGGEYSGVSCAANFTRSGEIYDPVLNTWAPIANHPDPQFGDDPSMLLNDGKILAGSINTRNTFLYDIAANTWSGAIPKVYNDRSDEETWVLLPDGRVLTYDLFQSVLTGGAYAEVFNPATNTWASISPSDGTALGAIPQLSSSALGFELGPAVRLHDGRVFIVGATGHTALYTPATNTWAAGPDVIGSLSGNPAIFGADDSPAAVLPNGHVLFLADAGPSFVTSSGSVTNGTGIVTNIPSTALLQVGWTVTGADIPTTPSPAVITSVDSPNQIHISRAATGTHASEPIKFGGTFSSPSQIFDFNPATNAIAPVSPALPTSLNHGAYITRLLMLPNGQVLYNNDTNQLWVYTPVGGPDVTVRPIVNNVTYDGGFVFTLTGRQLNGQSSGSSYGDDVESDQNYPIVRLQSAAGVFYARTTNWSTNLIATGALPETVNFTLSPGMPPGNYALTVSGSGLSGIPIAISITTNQIPGPF